MRITEAAILLDMTPRMLRYRESLGLLPVVRHVGRRRGARQAGPAGPAGLARPTGTAAASAADQASARGGTQTAFSASATATAAGPTPARAGAQTALSAATAATAAGPTPARDRAQTAPSAATAATAAGLTPARDRAQRAFSAATPATAAAGGHRQFTDADLAAVALGLAIERRYDISPTALAFGIRVLADPRVRADVADLGRRIGRLQPQPVRALDFEQERALRLLNQP